ncbi:MAG: chorismate synthase [Schwartzia sp. (in: firmicutes)]
MASFRFFTAGESHGACLIALIEGLPAGLKIDEERIDEALARRQRGYGRGGRMTIEADRAAILSGLRFGETIGSPITLRIENKDWVNWQDKMAPFGEPNGVPVTAARPGHADYPGVQKYNRQDIRDILERSSARETAARVAAGAVAKAFLSACGIEICSRVTDIGGVKAASDCWPTPEAAGSSDLNCFDPHAQEAMRARIREAKEAGDTLGGVFEVIVRGVPVGLGSHIQWDRRLDARLAAAFMSIQAVKGVEIGEGFRYAALPGSLAHDEMYVDDAKRVYRRTNYAGGIEGGMSNGEEILLRAVMKPIPTLMTPLHTVDIATKEAVLAAKERSDVCAVPAASLVGEAMAALILAGEVREKFGGDSMEDVLAALHAYRERLAGM